MKKISKPLGDVGDREIAGIMKNLLFLVKNAGKFVKFFALLRKNIKHSASIGRIYIPIIFICSGYYSKLTTNTKSFVRFQIDLSNV